MNCAIFDKSKECTWHVNSQEIPVLVCIGMMLHANIPKKEIVDRPHGPSMSIAKSTSLGLLYIRSDECSYEHLKEMGTIRPPSLEMGFFYYRGGR